MRSGFKAEAEEERMHCVRKRENEFQRIRKWKGGSHIGGLLAGSPAGNELPCF